MPVLGSAVFSAISSSPIRIQNIPTYLHPAIKHLAVDLSQQQGSRSVTTEWHSTDRLDRDVQLISNYRFNALRVDTCSEQKAIAATCWAGSLLPYSVDCGLVKSRGPFLGRVIHRFSSPAPLNGKADFKLGDPRGGLLCAPGSYYQLVGCDGWKEMQGETIFNY